MVGYDFIVCVINLILFLKPLCRLSRRISQINAETTSKFKKLIKKNALLASISIITSILAWVLIAIISGTIVVWQTVDIIVSSISIILLFSKNRRIFLNVCCCCCYFFKRDLYEEFEGTVTSTKSRLSLHTRSAMTVTTSQADPENVESAP